MLAWGDPAPSQHEAKPGGHGLQTRAGLGRCTLSVAPASSCHLPQLVGQACLPANLHACFPGLEDPPGNCLPLRLLGSPPTSHPIPSPANPLRRARGGDKVRGAHKSLAPPQPRSQLRAMDPAVAYWSLGVSPTRGPSGRFYTAQGSMFSRCIVRPCACQRYETRKPQDWVQTCKNDHCPDQDSGYYDERPQNRVA